MERVDHIYDRVLDGLHLLHMQKSVLQAHRFVRKRKRSRGGAVSTSWISDGGVIRERSLQGRRLSFEAALLTQQA